MKTTPFTLAALTQNLQRLCLIRAIVILFMAAATAYGFLFLNIDQQLPAIVTVIALQTLITLITLQRLRRQHAVTEREFFIQLTADIFLICLLTYMTGGATNPFVAYLLVPLSITAAILPRLHTAIIAALSVGGYSLLLFFYQPMSFFSHTENHALGEMAHATMAGTSPSDTALNPHYLGMWFNFLVSAILIAWFVSKMASAIRDQERAINQQREQQLHDEQILSIATLAAGTAHELGTPLNSLSLLVEEVEHSSAATLGESAQQDLALMKTQIANCQLSLKKLIAAAQQTQAGARRNITVGELLSDCINQWQPLRPDISLQTNFIAAQKNAVIYCDESLSQAITNLLNNAANASPNYVAIEAVEEKQRVGIHIRDRGEGIPAHIRPQQIQVTEAGRSPQKSGLGLGLFLSNASINRHGGQLQLRQLADGGTEATIWLPRATTEEQNGQKA